MSTLDVENPNVPAEHEVPETIDDLPLEDEEKLVQKEEKRYCWGYCTRRMLWWSICIGVTLLIILAIILILLFVVGQSMAQDSIDHSIMNVDSMQVLSTSSGNRLLSDNSNLPWISVQMAFTAYNMNFLGATLKTFDADFLFNGRKFAKAPMEEMKLAGSASANFDRIVKMEITDQSIFNEFSQFLVNSSRVTMTISGKVKVQPSGPLPEYKVDLKKDVVLEGMNNFQNPPPSLNSCDLKQTSDRYISDPKKYDNSLWMDAVNTLPNPSTMSVKNIGFVETDIFSKNNIWIGKGWSKEEVQVDTGYNNILKMEIMLQNNGENEDELRPVLSDYVNGIPQTLNIVGVSSSDPLWAEGVKAMKVPIVLDGLKNLEDKIFQNVNVMINGSMTNVVQDSMYVDYCGQKYEDFKCVNNSCTSLPNLLPVMGRVIETDNYVSNPLNLDVKLTDYEMDIDVFLPDENKFIPFTWANSNFNMPSPQDHVRVVDQRILELPAKSRTNIPIVFCSALQMATNYEKSFTDAQVGPALEVLHKTTFKGFGDIYNDWTLYKLTEEGSPLMPITGVHSNGAYVAPQFINVNASVTMSHEETNFKMTKLPVTQGNIVINQRYYSS